MTIVINLRVVSWLISGAVGLTLSFLLAFFCVSIYQSARHGTGDVDYCYIDRMEMSGGIPIYRLRGHVNWGNDLTIFTSPNFDDAVTSARKIDCHLGSK